MQKITKSIKKYNSPSFSAYEKTLVLLKPDAFRRKADNLIMQKILSKNLNIEDSFEGVASRKKIEVNYVEHSKKDFFGEWIDFMVSGPIRALIVTGEDAVSKMNALKKEIRLKYAPDEKRFNLIHTSDDLLSANREIMNMFDKNV